MDSYLSFVIPGRTVSGKYTCLIARELLAILFFEKKFSRFVRERFCSSGSSTFERSS
jgi:hypothetical protein